MQKKINIWARQRRSKGDEIKIGFGKVRVNGVWKFWNKIEKNTEISVEEEVMGINGKGNENCNVFREGKKRVKKEFRNGKGRPGEKFYF